MRSAVEQYETEVHGHSPNTSLRVPAHRGVVDDGAHEVVHHLLRARGLGLRPAFESSRAPAGSARSRPCAACRNRVRVRSRAGRGSAAAASRPGRSSACTRRSTASSSDRAAMHGRGGRGRRHPRGQCHCATAARTPRVRFARRRDPACADAALPRPAPASPAAPGLQERTPRRAGGFAARFQPVLTRKPSCADGDVEVGEAGRDAHHQHRRGRKPGPAGLARRPPPRRPGQHGSGRGCRGVDRVADDAEVGRATAARPTPAVPRERLPVPRPRPGTTGTRGRCASNDARSSGPASP